MPALSTRAVRGYQARDRRRTRGGSDEREDEELPALDAEVEAEEGERQLRPRQAERQEAARECEAVHEAEGEREHPAVANAAREEVLGADVGDAERDRGLDEARAGREAAEGRDGERRGVTHGEGGEHGDERADAQARTRDERPAEHQREEERQVVGARQDVLDAAAQERREAARRVHRRRPRRASAARARPGCRRRPRGGAPWRGGGGPTASVRGSRGRGAAGRARAGRCRSHGGGARRADRASASVQRPAASLAVGLDGRARRRTSLPARRGPARPPTARRGRPRRRRARARRAPRRRRAA